MPAWSWIVHTLRTYYELALFLALGIGFWIGPKKIVSLNLGNVTATLLAAIAIGSWASPCRVRSCRPFSSCP